MSIVVERFLICDGAGHCAESFGVYEGERTAKEHRKAAKLNGWTYRNGRDYCPEHAKELAGRAEEKG